MINTYTIPENSLADRTILVTGATRGIGKVAALEYAKHGATVLLMGRSVPKLEETYDAIVQHGFKQPAIIPLDLQGATKQNYLDLAATIENEYGHLDGLLFNAGSLGTLGPIETIPEEEYDLLMQVNVKSNLLMTQTLLPVLKQSKDASIIYTTSTVGHVGVAYWGTYSISKFAVEGMMKVLAEELKNTHVRTNCINPGGTRTDMRAKAFPGEDPQTLATPEDIMPVYLYLMSQESQAVNGQILNAQKR